jgi:hypothetical protein
MIKNLNKKIFDSNRGFIFLQKTKKNARNQD